MQDYFEFFKIERKFRIDTSALRKQYIRNNMKYHPDFHAMDNTENQEAQLQLSTLNNEAYKALSNDRSRTLHLLQLENALPEEGHAQLPQSFLIEMMDINEALVDARLDNDQEKLLQLENEIQALEETLQSDSDEAQEKWDLGPTASLLESIRNIYLKQQYLRRLKDQIHNREPEI